MPFSQPATGPLLERQNADFNFHGLPAPAQRKAFHRRHVTIVPPPRQGDVGVGGHQVIGGIETQPSVSRIEYRHPGMRGCSSLKLRAAADVATHVSRRQAERTKDADHEVSKILAHAPAVMKYFKQRRIYRCGLGLIDEFVMDAAGEFFERT